MSDISSAEMGMKVEAPTKKFTPLPPEVNKDSNFSPINKELIARGKEPSKQTESSKFPDWNESDINAFLKNLETQGTLPKEANNPKQLISEVTKNIPNELKQSPGFLAKIWESFLKVIGWR
jgi:hypothetical protein